MNVYAHVCLCVREFVRGCHLSSLVERGEGRTGREQTETTSGDGEEEMKDGDEILRTRTD